MTTPTYYAAHPIDEGAVGPTAEYLGRCGAPGCPYWADHPTDLGQVVDAIAGHRAREHPENATDEPDRRPTTLLDRLGESMRQSPHYRPGRAAGEGDAAEHDISPGVLTFGRAERRDGYHLPQDVPESPGFVIPDEQVRGDPGAPLAPSAMTGFYVHDQDGVAAVRRGERAVGRRSTPSPHPRDRQQDDG